MPSNPPTAEMGRIHEDYIAAVLRGRRTRASGSQWFDQGDVRNNHDEPFAFCADGKSTKGKSITVTLAMIAKVREQAQGERPALPLRWYGNDNLDQVLEDWFLVTGPDMEELLDAARAWAAVQASLGVAAPEDLVGRLSLQGEERENMTAAVTQDANVVPDKDRRIAELTSALSEAHGTLIAAGQRIAAQDLEIQGLRAQAASPAFPPGMLRPPRLPWTVVRLFSDEEKAHRSARREPDGAGEATEYAADGTMRERLVKVVRVERSPGNRPKLIADAVQARYADAYAADGTLLARVCHDDPAIEVG